MNLINIGLYVDHIDILLIYVIRQMKGYNKKRDIWKYSLSLGNNESYSNQKCVMNQAGRQRENDQHDKTATWVQHNSSALVNPIQNHQDNAASKPRVGFCRVNSPIDHRHVYNHFRPNRRHRGHRRGRRGRADVGRIRRGMKWLTYALLRVNACARVRVIHCHAEGKCAGRCVR